MGSKINKIFIILFFTHIMISANDTVAASEASESKKKFNFFKNEKTLILNPFELRDPFKRKRFFRKNRGKKVKTTFTSFSNLPQTDNIDMEKLIIVGVLIGKNRRAIARLNGDKKGAGTFILREGMIIGENKAEIKAILPGGIVLVEKIRNIYDQDEYLETIIPVTDAAGQL